MNVKIQTVKLALDRILAVAVDPVNSSLQAGFRDYLDPCIDNEERDKRLKESLEEIQDYADYALKLMNGKE